MFLLKNILLSKILLIELQTFFKNVLLFRHYSSFNRDLYYLDPIDECEEDEEYE